MMLATEINLSYYEELMADARKAIAEGRFDDFCAATKAGWEQGEQAKT